MQFVSQAASTPRLHKDKTSNDFFGSPRSQPHESIVSPPRLVTNKARYLLGKRFVDVVAAGTLILFLAPVFLLVAAAVKLSSRGPIFFRQERLTEGGRRFQLIKFRSMVIDAEERSGAQFAVRNDPRVTTVGKFIRKTRLDELPQLINVLRGDMSLIGPRPERPELAQELSKTIRRFPQRLAAKAGITGLAQVIQGYPDNLSGYRRKVSLDLLYIRNQGLLLDLWIALRTIGVIISGLGAR
jgi:lipopolysaccharide/colanic/teichoic acid biosynthesis glycosyltransferase